MGIPHLITLLQPYAETEVLAGNHAVIDGPGFAYHVFSFCEERKGAASKSSEPASLTYKQLGDAAITLLDQIQASGVLM